MRILFRMLSAHMSKSQLAGFVISNLVGLAIIMSALVIYQDASGIFSGNDTFMGKDYIIVSKRMSSSMVGNAGFSEAEIKDLASQDFCVSLSPFVSSSFRVSATMGISKIGAGLRTDMFFESVDDSFVDVSSSMWSYEEGSDTIPIILPRDYLNLYNLGFAEARNMPRLTDAIISMISLDIRIDGRKSGSFTGRVAGFSSRLNTILVPKSFMDYANREFGGEMKAPARIIVEVSNPADERISEYLNDNGYETAKDKIENSQISWMLRMLVSAVMLIGLIISLLSLFILLLSIFLLVERNISKIENLLLLGYSAGRVAVPYMVSALALNIVSWAMSSLLAIALRQSYLPLIEDMYPDFEPGSILLVLMSGLLLVIIFSLADSLLIYRKINGIIKH